MLSFKPTFSRFSFTFINRRFSSSSLSAIRVVSSAHLRLLVFLPVILIPAYMSDSLQPPGLQHASHVLEFAQTHTEFQPMGVVEVVEVTTTPLSSHLFFMKHLIYFYIFNYMNDFIKGLSILLRGTVQEKLNWAFNLYDINKDGYITKEEMLDIMKAIYDMMGKCTYPVLKEDAPRQHVETFFQKMDKNKDGVVTIDEFIESCQKDENIMRSMQLFENVI
ncbi:hypothetical protein FD755_019919 [Muntiacus reevesi]|uniref:Kv channel-interacting protein 4 n=1 Tax=Muntiacus reevesi TaxID=9886 RepID=A0A5N3X4W4_MUNRE|nr:hypothetical protein FD755_019919 [Muntiacus reevesi]